MSEAENRFLEVLGGCLGAGIVFRHGGRKGKLDQLIEERTFPLEFEVKGAYEK